MNNSRRKQLSAILSVLEDMNTRIEEIKDEEQDCFDNMPEGLQGSEKGEKAENAISALEDVISSLEEAISRLQDAQE